MAHPGSWCRTLCHDPVLFLSERLCRQRRDDAGHDVRSRLLVGRVHFYGAWVLPPLLALAARRATDWAMLVFGGLLFIMSTLAGVFDGLRDGGHLVGLELLAVTLPGVVALLFTWRHIRST